MKPIPSIFQTFFFLAVVFSAAASLPFSEVCAEEIGIVAVVNDEVVTQAELDRALAPIYLQMQAALKPEELALQVEEVKQKVLEQIIEERLMLQEARDPRPIEVSKGRIGTPPPIEVTDEEVDEMLAEAQEHFDSSGAFAQAMELQGVSLEVLRERYREQITIRKLIDRECRYRVVVSPTEVTDYYQANSKEFISPPAVQVAAILIRSKGVLGGPRARTSAEDLRKRLMAGEAFQELAERYSEGLNAKGGGRIGWLEQGRSRPEIEAALFKLKLGEISQVIETPAGFHIFRIESTRPSRKAELKEIEGRIRHMLINQKAGKKYETWIKKLKSEAYITIK